MSKPQRGRSRLSGDLLEATSNLRGAAAALRSAATELGKLPDAPARHRLETDVRLLREQVVDLLVQVDDVRERGNLDVDFDPAGVND